MNNKQPIFAVIVAILLLAVALMALPQAGPAQAAPLLSGENGTRDTITPTSLSYSGVAYSAGTASGDGQKFANTGQEFLYVANATGDTITLTIVTGGQFNGFEIDDVTVVIANSASKFIGPFDRSVFNQRVGSDTGKIYLNWNAAVTDTVADDVSMNIYKLQ